MQFKKSAADLVNVLGVGPEHLFKRYDGYAVSVRGLRIKKKEPSPNDEEAALYLEMLPIFLVPFKCGGGRRIIRKII